MLAAAVLLAASGPALAGCYVAAAGPDVASAIELKADGRFRYALAAGALDERAEGRWTLEPGRLSLRTEPLPKPATFALKGEGRAGGEKLTLRVVWPDGNGIAGVDLVVGLDDGRTLEGYTQEDGWSLPAGETHPPRWVEFAVPMHDLKSQRFAINAPAGALLTYEITPNDLGVIDFSRVAIDVTRDALVVHRGGEPMEYRRRARC